MARLSWPARLYIGAIVASAAVLLIRGPFGGVPAMIRVDRGLDFAATAVRDVMAALCIAPHRLPGYYARVDSEVR